MPDEHGRQPWARPELTEEQRSDLREMVNLFLAHNPNSPYLIAENAYEMGRLDEARERIK